MLLGFFKGQAALVFSTFLVQGYMPLPSMEVMQVSVAGRFHRDFVMAVLRAEQQSVFRC